MTQDAEILALHRQLAYQKLRADLAEARADAKSRECIELRERMAARPPIPRTAEQAIAFIGNQYECSEDAEHLDDVRYQLTVHDLLSAFDWWFGEAEAAPSDGELYEAASRRADPAAHDAALAESLAVFGSSAALTPEHKAAQQAANAAATQRLDTAPRRLRGVISEDSPLVRAHRAAEAQAGQRESVTVTEKGPWQVDDWGQGRIVIQSDDFTHDVALEISGDFGSVEREIAYAEEIARRLNAYRVRPYSDAVAAAAERYQAQFASAHPLPAQWSWSELWNAMEHAAIDDRVLYTCVGKGGTYERLGPAVGAGSRRDTIVIVYRDVKTGQFYYRDPVDFGERMAKIEEPA